MSEEKLLKKFNPTKVDTLWNYISRLTANNELFVFDKTYEISKNIVYSFQYLEYLDYTLSPEQPVGLTDVIERMTIRTFIITGMSIIEAILYYMLSIRNLHQKKKYELVTTFINQKLNDKKTITLRQVTHLYKVLDDDKQEEDIMDLHNMIKKAQHNEILGDKKDDIYKELNYLRRLRNTIHLQDIQERNGSQYDIIYHKFTMKELNKMKKIMYDFLLISQILNPSQAQKEFPYLIFSESSEINDFIMHI